MLCQVRVQSSSALEVRGNFQTRFCRLAWLAAAGRRHLMCHHLEAPEAVRILALLAHIMPCHHRPEGHPGSQQVPGVGILHKQHAPSSPPPDDGALHPADLGVHTEVRAP